MGNRAPSYFTAVARGFRLSFQFSGRDTRAEFWPFAFTSFLIPSLVEFAAAQIRLRQFAATHPNYLQDLIEGRISEQSAEIIQALPQFNPFPLAWFSIAAAALFVLPYLAAVTRRLHDQGMRGWWVIPQIVLLAAAWYVDLRFAKNGDAFLGSEGFRYMLWSFTLSGFTALWTLLLIYIAVHDGDRGDNHFGPDPKNRILKR